MTFFYALYFVFFTGAFLLIGFCIKLFIQDFKKGNKSSSYSSYSDDYDSSDYETSTWERHKKSPRRKRSWQDEYNEGHKAGREDSLYNDGYGYFHHSSRRQSDAYKAGYQAGHDEEWD